MPIDQNLCNEVVGALQIIHDPLSPGDRRKVANEFIERFKLSSEALEFSVAVLTSTDVQDNVRHFALHILEKRVGACGEGERAPEMNECRGLLLNVTAGRLKEVVLEPVYIQEKIAELFTNIAKWDYPEVWPSFIDDLAQLWRLGGTPMNIAVRVLRTLIQDCLSEDFKDNLPVKRRGIILKNLTPALPPIMVVVMDSLSYYHTQLKTSADPKARKESEILLGAITDLITVASQRCALSSTKYPPEQCLSILLPLLLHESTRQKALQAVLALCSRPGDQYEETHQLQWAVLRSLPECYKSLNIQSLQDDEELDFLRLFCKLLHALGPTLIRNAVIECSSSSSSSFSTSSSSSTLMASEPPSPQLRLTTDASVLSACELFLQVCLESMAHPSVRASLELSALWQQLLKEPHHALVERLAPSLLRRLLEKLVEAEGEEDENAILQTEAGFDEDLCRQLLRENRQACAALVRALALRWPLPVLQTVAATVAECFRQMQTAGASGNNNNSSSNGGWGLGDASFPVILSPSAVSSGASAVHPSPAFQQQLAAFASSCQIFDGLSRLVVAMLDAFHLPHLERSPDFFPLLERFMEMLLCVETTDAQILAHLVKVYGHLGRFLARVSQRALSLTLTRLFDLVAFRGDAADATSSSSSSSFVPASGATRTSPVSLAALPGPVLKVRRGACQALARVARSARTQMVALLHELSGRVTSLLQQGAILRQEQLMLYEMLAQVAQAISDPSARYQFLDSILEEPMKLWLSEGAREAFSHPHSLLKAFGLDQTPLPAPEQSGFDVMQPLTAFLTVAHGQPAGSSSVKGSEHPFFRYWRLILPHLVQLTWCVHALWQPDTRHAIRNAPSTRFVLALSDSEAALLLREGAEAAGSARGRDRGGGGGGGGGGGAAGAGDVTQQELGDVQQQWARYLSSLRREIYELLQLAVHHGALFPVVETPPPSTSFAGSASASVSSPNSSLALALPPPHLCAVLLSFPSPLEREQAALELLPVPLETLQRCLLEGLHCMEHRHLSFFINVVLRPLLQKCPVPYLKPFLAPFVCFCFQHFAQRLSAAWRMHRRQERGDQGLAGECGHTFGQSGNGGGGEGGGGGGLAAAGGATGAAARGAGESMKEVSHGPLRALLSSCPLSLTSSMASEDASRGAGAAAGPGAGSVSAAEAWLYRSEVREGAAEASEIVQSSLLVDLSRSVVRLVRAMLFTVPAMAFVHSVGKNEAEDGGGGVVGTGGRGGGLGAGGTVAGTAGGGGPEGGSEAQQQLRRYQAAKRRARELFQLRRWFFLGGEGCQAFSPLLQQILVESPQWADGRLCREALSCAQDLLEQIFIAPCTEQEVTLHFVPYYVYCDQKTTAATAASAGTSLGHSLSHANDAGSLAPLTSFPPALGHLLAQLRRFYWDLFGKNLLMNCIELLAMELKHTAEVDIQWAIVELIKDIICRVCLSLPPAEYSVMGYSGAKIKYTPPADVESCVYVKQVLLTIVNGREDLLAEFEAKLQRESTERMRKFLVKEFLFQFLLQSVGEERGKDSNTDFVLRRNLPTAVQKKLFGGANTSASQANNTGANGSLFIDTNNMSGGNNNSENGETKGSFQVSSPTLTAVSTLFD